MRVRKGFLTEKLNDLSIGKKLALLQIFCVILPLFITDGVIWTMIVNADRQTAEREMQDTAEAVKYTLSDSIGNAVSLMQNIYSSRSVNEFMKTEFDSYLDYFEQYNRLMQNSFYSVLISNSECRVVIYGDNDSIMSGGYFRKLEEVEDCPWYQKLMQSSEETVEFSEYANNGFTSRRTISLVRRMDYYAKEAEHSIIKLDLDYNGISRMLLNRKYQTDFYICEGDRILFSNDGRGGAQAPFDTLDAAMPSQAGLHDVFNIYGEDWDIYVMEPKMDYKSIVVDNFLLLLGLTSVNLLLPFLLMGLINRSFTQRILELDSVFRDVDVNELKSLPQVKGKDEIGALMASYNRMAGRMNELIQTVYKNRLKSQEIDIARQKAELLALNSQINPHFLFNALESIRMHSVLKHEFETADMVQKLALVERQNVDWGNDYVRILDEVKIIEAYLELQKYRFGAKLTYEIIVDEECNAYRIPKLTLVTFVENACVHGMESKTSSSWIFLRIYREREMLVIEVEDTGSGMPQEQCRQFVEEMSQVSIEMLKENRHVGMLNAALRLKMFTDGGVRFEMDSEVGAGTMVTVRIPVQASAPEEEKKE